jgi:hypothetical protein
MRGGFLKMKLLLDFMAALQFYIYQLARRRVERGS